MDAVIVKIKSTDKDECKKMISLFSEGCGKFMSKYDFNVTELNSTKSKGKGEVFEIELSLHGEIHFKDLVGDN